MDSGMGNSFVTGIDSGSKKNAVGLAQIMDLGAVEKFKPVDKSDVAKAMEMDTSIEENTEANPGEYSMSHVWNSDEEEARVREESQCKKKKGK